MDKRVILSVAGSGKTTYIISKLSNKKRSLILTYTENNTENIKNKIRNRFNGSIPSNINVMTFFSFLYNFCYKPLVFPDHPIKGICFKKPQKYSQRFFLNEKYIFSWKISHLLENYLSNICERIARYYDEFVIDELQDIASRDFHFLEELIKTIKIDVLLVGDFFQHTFDTSNDGFYYKNLHQNEQEYVNKLIKAGLQIDKITLSKSFRCTKEVCNFIREKLGIEIESNSSERSLIKEIILKEEIDNILKDDNIVKLVYQNSKKYDFFAKNWGECKGEDKYVDVCVIMNKNTYQKYTCNKLKTLPQKTKNKLYVAITRARKNVLFIAEDKVKNWKKKNNR